MPMKVLTKALLEAYGGPKEITDRRGNKGQYPEGPLPAGHQRRWPKAPLVNGQRKKKG